MSATDADRSARDALDVAAYSDGELRGWRRWWFERRLARSPALRAELDELRRVSRWVRALEVEARSVDLWDRIALRLLALDAELAEARAAREAGRWAPFARPLAAVAAGAALAVAIALGIMQDGVASKPGVIRWLDTGGRGVMVLEDQGDATIVWLLDAPEEDAGKGGSRETI